MPQHPLNSLIAAIRTKDYQEATESIGQVLQQKVSELLVQEREAVGRTLVKEAADPETFFSGSDKKGWVLIHKGQPLNANPQGGVPVSRERVKQVAKQFKLPTDLPVWNGKDYTYSFDGAPSNGIKEDSPNKWPKTCEECGRRLIGSGPLCSDCKRDAKQLDDAPNGGDFRKLHEAEALNKTSFKVECLECGKIFSTKKMVPTCPKCGGSDIDLAESVDDPKGATKTSSKCPECGDARWKTDSGRLWCKKCGKYDRKFGVEEDKTYDTKTNSKCKSCGKTFTPSYGEYARCPKCLAKQSEAGEKASQTEAFGQMNNCKACHHAMTEHDEDGCEHKGCRCMATAECRLREATNRYTETQMTNAWKYANTIRNTDKKEYALSCLDYAKRTGKDEFDDVDTPKGLGTMAAQAVRHHLRDTLNEDIISITSECRLREWSSTRHECPGCKHVWWGTALKQCPNCHRKIQRPTPVNEDNISAVEVQRVYDEHGDIPEVELLCGITNLIVNAAGEVVSFVSAPILAEGTHAVEASDLGIEPGKWPQTLTFRGTTYTKGAPKVTQGELDYYVYTSGGDKLNVFND